LKNRPEGSLDELIPPAHTESSVTFSSRSALTRDSGVNLLYLLADHLSRGFLSVDDFSVYGFPASGARSRSSSNPARYTVFSPLLDFSGSAGFGTWRIFVSLFWVTCRLFSSFLLFWVLERFWSMDFKYFVYPCSIETSRGSILILWSFYTYLPFVPLRQKLGVYVSFWTGNVFLTGLVFLSKNGQRGGLLVFGSILLTKSLLCNVVAFIGIPYISESSDIQSLFF
jgi:hypothetical protein